MRTLTVLGAAVVAIAVGLGGPTAANAQTGKATIKKGTVATPAKAKRFYSARPAARVHYSRPPRVVG